MRVLSGVKKQESGLFDVYPRFDVTPVRAEGVYVYDEKDAKYLDLYGGHGVMSIGHCHPEYVAQVNRQLNQIGFYSNSVKMPIQEELADKLCEVSGYHNYKLFLCNSGAEANENGLKLASFHTGKTKVIAFHGSFHGRTAAALNVTDNSRLSAPLNKDNFEVVFLDLNDEKALLNALKNRDVSAVIVEGIQGVGGLDAPTEDFLRFTAEQCKAHDALLITDEVQSGYGRTGRFFAHQHADIAADIICMAKGMGNGFPIGGILIAPHIQASSGMLGTTFGGNHLACAAGIAVLDTIKKESLTENVDKVSDYLMGELQSITALKRIKGKGLMLGVEFDYPVKDLRSQLLYQFQIFTGGSANPNLLRILPPLNITIEEIKPFVQALKKLLQ